MPRRNQNDSGRKGSVRSGGRPESRRNEAGKKPFRKEDKRTPRKPSEGKSYEARKGSSSRTSRPTRGGTTSSGKPFKKSGSGYSRKTSFKSSKEPGSSGEETRNESFSQKSRFSQSARGGSGARTERGTRSRRGESGSFDKREGSSGATPERKPFRETNRFPKSPSSRNRSGGSKEGRAESFGKPYKKVYKSRPEREGMTSSRKKQETAEGTPKSDKVRLNKFIANSGISSRREADELITMGLISVNGQVITELGYKVSPGDEVRYENKVLRAEKPVYILLNKPKGFITTTDDPQERKTVMHIIGAAVKERIYPVGRLDRNTTGLLLLTNDGDLADKLMHPSFNVKKVYKVELDRALTKADFQTITEGVRLEEGRATVDDLAIVSEDGRTVGIELHIGWNRVVRRIFENLGYEVLKLDRTVYAGLDKKELGRGQWRFLSKEEIVHLKHFK